MRSHSKKIFNFNRNLNAVCEILRPENYQNLKFNHPLIARGQGSNYGDSALNSNGHVLLTERLNCLSAFDKQKGIITAEAGITIGEILKVIVPAGWFIPVTPGTQFVSLGGCVACDVHGKNHHRTGSFSKHVLSIELLMADGSVMECSATQHADIFWATVGGMGLTGVITKVTLQLIPVSQSYMRVKHVACQNIDETLNYLADPAVDDEYSVAWLDLLSSKNFARSIVMTAHHGDETISTLSPTKKKLTIPFTFPSWFLNQKGVTFFNEYYFKIQSQKQTFISHYQPYFYPLDKIKNWPYLYGRKGFAQYQCVFPLHHAKAGISLLLQRLQKSSYPVYLAVLKRLGDSSRGMLSFPMPGFTLALDMPITSGLDELLRDFDKTVLEQGGRVYLAKDSRLTPESFRLMYPRYEEWLSIKNKIDSQNRYSSDLAKRLEITS